jgi:hypothetical protein
VIPGKAAFPPQEGCEFHCNRSANIVCVFVRPRYRK